MFLAFKSHNSCHKIPTERGSIFLFSQVKGRVKGSHFIAGAIDLLYLSAGLQQ